MLKKINLLLFSASILSVAAASCTYSNEEELIGTTQCDTSAVTYSNDIVPILKSKCYRCHDAANVSTSGYQMDSYSLLLVYVNAGSLIDRINDPVNPMPTEGLMDECSRAKIQAWVNAGALDN